MKRALLLTCSIFTIHACSAQIWSYADNFNIPHTVSDFGLVGGVKSYTQTYTHLNSDGIQLPGNDQYFRKYKEHFNFDENGMLISSYEIGEKGDTVGFSLLKYGENQKLSSAKLYEPSWEGKSTMANLNSWEMTERTYVYSASGTLHKVLIKNHAGLGGGTEELVYSYDELGRILSTTATDKSFGEEKAIVQSYTYVGSTPLIDLILITNEERPEKNGKFTFVYDEELHLMSKTFTPDLAAKKTEWGGEEEFYVYDESGNLLKNILGDSTKWPVYQYDIRSYNEHNDAITHHYVADYDGQGKTHSEISYSYDEQGNWIVQTIVETTDQAYPAGVKPLIPVKTYVNYRTFEYALD